MRVLTKAYGERELDDRQRVSLPAGLFGFEDLHDWALLDAHRPPFYWLQSLDRVEVAFVLLDPLIFRPDYEPAIESAELAELGIVAEEDRLLLVIVTIPEGSSPMTANLQGPLLVNRRTRVGRQCISTDPRWGVRHTVLEELAATGTAAC